MKQAQCLFMICLLLVGAVAGCGRGAATATPQPTATATPLPTATPSPTATAQPSAAIPAGWQKFEGGGVELWLPESYQGGDLSQDVDVIVENLKRLGPDFEQIAQTIEQNPSLYAIWAFDSKVGESGFLTNVSVTNERVLSAVTMDIYLDAVAKNLPAAFQVLERDIVTLKGYQAGRLVLDFAASGIVPGKELVYIIKDGTTMRILTFATGRDEFEDRLPVFEQIALTFATQP